MPPIGTSTRADDPRKATLSEFRRHAMPQPRHAVAGRWEERLWYGPARAVTMTGATPLLITWLLRVVIVILLLAGCATLASATTSRGRIVRPPGHHAAELRMDRHLRSELAHAREVYRQCGHGD